MYYIVYYLRGHYMLNSELIAKIESLSLGCIPSSHAESISCGVISFVGENSIEKVENVLNACLTKIDEIVSYDNLVDVSVSVHFKDLQSIFDVNDDLLKSINIFISSEVINMSEHIGRNIKHDQNDLILDLYCYFENILVAIDSSNV